MITKTYDTSYDTLFRAVQSLDIEIEPVMAYPITNDTITIDDLQYVISTITEFITLFDDILDLMKDVELFKDYEGLKLYMNIKTFLDQSINMSEKKNRII